MSILQNKMKKALFNFFDENNIEAKIVYFDFEISASKLAAKIKFGDEYLIKPVVLWRLKNDTENEWEQSEYYTTACEFLNWFERKQEEDVDNVECLECFLIRKIGGDDNYIAQFDNKVLPDSVKKIANYEIKIKDKNILL